MSRRLGVRRALGLALFIGCSGCTGGALTDQLAPPPEGFPTLAREYAVDVEYLAGDCASGGLVVQGLTATVSVVQDGASFKWTQTVAEDQLTLKIGGVICPTADGAGFELQARALRKGRARWADGARVCEVQARFPAGSTGVSPTECGAEDVLVLPIDTQTGGLVGEVFIGLEYRRDCADAARCVLRTRWKVTPTVAALSVDAGLTAP